MTFDKITEKKLLQSDCTVYTREKRTRKNSYSLKQEFLFVIQYTKSAITKTTYSWKGLPDD